MNDYWNDPPEQPEPPECCGDIMEVDEKTGAMFCLKCGQRIEPQPDPELPIEKEIDCDTIKDNPTKCPHGNDWHNCDACDYASDIAYDIAREHKYFGR